MPADRRRPEASRPIQPTRHDLCDGRIRHPVLRQCHRGEEASLAVLGEEVEDRRDRTARPLGPDRIEELGEVGGVAYTM
jgi:hypothetical protein